MPRLLVSDRAQRGLISIGEYIARDNVDAAMRFYAAAEAAFDLLAHLPGAGPKVDPPIHAQPDMRFWPIARYRNYLVLYREIEDGVEILRVVHGARDIGNAFADG
jgi:toxin ParE1/3/4